MKIQIYTDGCCLSNQSTNNRGGWAFIVIKDDKEIDMMCGNIVNTTNQRMEITACISAMTLGYNEYFDEDIEIISDSAYVVNCVKDGWYLKWIQNGWLNSKKEPVKNKDLWESFVKLLEQRYFKFSHIKAHSGHKWNELVDKYANNAARGAS